MQKETLIQLASQRNNPSVSISLNTHRTRPDNAKDRLLLKNLAKDAETRLLAQFSKREIGGLLEKLSAVQEEIDVSRNLESLHIFLSDTTKEVVRSTWPCQKDAVYISDGFFVRPLIKAYNRSENYLIMLLSQSGVHLFEASNDSILEEVTEEGFPFPENPYVVTSKQNLSDSKLVDNRLREYLNQIDKALNRVINDSGLRCVVISTQGNYSQLMKVADRPNVYLGYAAINYNDTASHTIVAQAWKLVMEKQKEKREQAIAEAREAISQGKLVTELQDIFRAALEGRGDLLIVHQDFIQAVKMIDEQSFEVVENEAASDIIDDIGSVIAWEVISRKGRVVYTDQSGIADLGKIALKVRY